MTMTRDEALEWFRKGVPDDKILKYVAENVRLINCVEKPYFKIGYLRVQLPPIGQQLSEREKNYRLAKGFFTSLRSEIQNSGAHYHQAVKMLEAVVGQ
jgi:hypothetical protein